MSNIRNVQWNEGAPEKLEAGMLVEANDTKSPDYRIRLVGDVLPDEATDGGECPPLLDHIKRWAWLIRHTVSPDMLEGEGEGEAA